MSNGALNPQFDLRLYHYAQERLVLEGWLTTPATQKLFAIAGTEFDALKRAAAERNFRAVPLGV